MASFEQVAATFWHDDNKRGALAPLTPAALADAERKLGLKLPADLLTLLEHQNGGVVAEAWDACPAPANSWSSDHVPFDHLMGVGPAGGDRLTLLDTEYLVGEWDLPSPVVLLSGDGHYWIALDYRECGPTGEPAVVWLDSDDESEFRIAPDFRAFLEHLTPSEGFAD
ncbi:SMI1/KNR4 family protein [Actinoplanes bogorensis]|uniref:SMI1/KNR4 family protein n=1 Tax=Paractinoplanes bogorensis TaxID=1610840 RepID=A0ABS5YJG7_9ACTN|nr:SMI1/KNR4 family protein [Actinoplanes bogorensis]MBU2663612.1 SMI1/KNR4 family protein [Actinoplanes bogorensis]